eukprot:GEZU01012438.1.p1 GENE.GEZU01012438.1~~GEZU01012438.1.p1  ORF type:complete len:517 (-),score=149.42 GEZU01012438.1:31-1425(-)
MGQYEQAVDHYNQAIKYLKTFEKDGPVRNMKIANILTNMGIAKARMALYYEDASNYVLTEKRFIAAERDIKSSADAFQKYDPAMKDIRSLEVYFAYGILYQLKGVWKRRREEDDEMNRTEQIVGINFTEPYSFDAPVTSSPSSGSSDEYFDKSIEYFQTALSKKIRPPFEERCMVEIGKVHFHRGNYAAAENQYRDAYNKTKGKLQKGHFMGNILFHIAKLYEKQYRFQEAANLYLECANERKKTYLTHSPFTAEAYLNAGVMFLKMDDFEQAHRCISDALNVNLYVHVKHTHNQLGPIYSRLLQLCLIKGEVIEAKKLIVLVTEAYKHQKESIQLSIKEKEKELEVIFTSEDNESMIGQKADFFQSYDDVLFHIKPEELAKAVKVIEEEHQLFSLHQNFSLAFLDGNKKKAHDIILSADLSAKTNKRIAADVKFQTLIARFLLQDNQVPASLLACLPACSRQN